MMTHEFLKIGTIPVYFQEDWGTGIGGGLWLTGLALAKYLNSSHASQQVHRLANQKKETGHLNILEWKQKRTTSSVLAGIGQR